MRLVLLRRPPRRCRRSAATHQVTLNTVAPGRLGAAPRPLRGERRRRLRRHRVGPPARARRRRDDGRPLHQHAACPGADRRDGRACSAGSCACRSSRARPGSTSTAPLADLQGWSDVRRGEALFESVLVFENYPPDASGAGATRPTREAAPAGAGADELSAHDRGGTRAPADVETHIRLSAGSTARAIVRLSGHLRVVLEAMAARSRRPGRHASAAHRGGTAARRPRLEQHCRRSRRRQAWCRSSSRSRRRGRRSCGRHRLRGPRSATRS